MRQSHSELSLVIALACFTACGGSASDDDTTMGGAGGSGALSGSGAADNSAGSGGAIAGSGGTGTGAGGSLGGSGGALDDGAGGTGNVAASAGAGGSGGAVSTETMCGYNLDASGNMIVPALAPQNYTFESVLHISTTGVAPNMPPFVDWSGLTQDFLKHDLDAQSEIDLVVLLMFRLTEPEVEAKLNADDVKQRDLRAFADFQTGNSVTRASVYEFGINGEPVEREDLEPFFDAAEFPPEEFTYALLAGTGLEAGQGVRMIQMFKLDPNSETDTVSFTDSSTTIEYTTDLHTAGKTPIPLGNANVLFDWAGMSGQLNALGQEFVTTQISEVLVAKYAQTPEELESQFLDLEIIAEKMYRGSTPTGTTLALNTLTEETTGEAFAGIDDSGTWIAALVCGECANPAPWYISILEPNCAE